MCLVVPLSWLCGCRSCDLEKSRGLSFLILKRLVPEPGHAKAAEMNAKCMAPAHIQSGDAS